MRKRRRLPVLLTGMLLAAGLSVSGITSYAGEPPAEEEGEETAASKAVYSVEEAYINDDRIVFAVYADHSGEYQIDFNGNTEDRADVGVWINGIPSGSIQIPDAAVAFTLNRGINTITIPYTDSIKEIDLHDCTPKESRGATTAYITYEAEDCTTNATILEDSRVFHEIASEASGRRAVQLDSDGQYIKFELKDAANAIVLRYCVPDNKEGTGEAYTLSITAGSDKMEAVVDSYHTWVYGELPFTNTPEDGKEHNFFDETAILFDAVYPAGTEITISKEAGDAASYYMIDLVETELVEPANLQPQNSISITEYGAVPDDGEDDTQALLDCIAAAAAEGKEVWIPEGKFHFNESIIAIDKDGTTIRGAGMWHTVLTGDYAAFLIRANNTAFYDFKMEGTAVVRRDDVDPAAYEVASSTYPKENFLLQNIWIEHYKVGVWTYNISGVHIVGCRIRNTFADGTNLCKGTCNSMVEQSSYRGTGDDSIAMWSQTYADVNNIVRYNTISLPDLANCVAIYGGKEIVVSDNVISDTVTEGCGINISTNFMPAEFGDTILVERNTLNRCGSLNDQSGAKIGAIWFNTVVDYDNPAEVVVRDNIISDSSYQGMSFSGIGTISDVLIENNTIENSGTWAIEASSSTRGGAVVRNNRITGNTEGEVNSNNAQNFTFTVEGMETGLEIGEVQEENSNSLLPLIGIFAAVIIVGISIVTVILNLRYKKVEKKGAMV